MLVRGDTCRAGAKGLILMRVLSAVLTAIGLTVVLILIVAVGVFAYDEARRRLVGDEFAPQPPAEGSAS